MSVSSVQFSLSVVSDSATPWTAAHQASLSITDSRSLFKLMSITLVMPSNRLILCHPLLLLPSIFPSIGVFSNESALHIRWPKYWHFSLSISPSNEYSGLMSFRMDWLDLLAVQGTLKSLLQHHSSKQMNKQGQRKRNQICNYQRQGWGGVCSVQFSRSVMSYSLLPRGLQHPRPPCPSPTPGAYSNSYPSTW